MGDTETLLIDTHQMTVREWEFNKEKLTKDGWAYAPDVMVLMRPVSSDPEEDLPRESFRNASGE